MRLFSLAVVVCLVSMALVFPWYGESSAFVFRHQNKVEAQPQGGKHIAPLPEGYKAPGADKPAAPAAPAAPADPAAPAAGKTVNEPGKPASGAPGETTVSAAKGGISFFFDDADIYEVIQTVFGEVLKVNYIIDSKVQGRVNFRTVSPIPKDGILKVMEIIFRLNGIGIVREGGLYRIIPLKDISREPVAIRFGKEPGGVRAEGVALMQIIPLASIESTEMSKILKPLLSTGGKLVDIPKWNYLMVADTDASIKRLLEVVKIFDDEALKDMGPSIYIYPLQNSKALHINGLLQQLFMGASASKQAAVTAAKTRAGASAAKTRAASVAAKAAAVLKASAAPAAATTVAAGSGQMVSAETRIFADEITNSILVLANKKDYQLIKETIVKLDVLPRQVLIEVLVAEAQLSNEFSLGIEWYLKSKVTAGNTPLDGSIKFDTTSVGANPLGFSFTAVDSAGVIRGILETLAADSKLKILASPHIMVSDNRQARIQVGDEVPLVTSETNVSGTTNIQRTIQYRATGVILEVTPQINEGGLVILEITQEVSFPKVATASGVQSPTISKREASTHLVVKDGQTVVMGGLIQENKEIINVGVPFLRRIPILGYLFGYKKKTTRTTELVVLITPHVVSEENNAETISGDFLRKLDGLRLDIYKTWEEKPDRQK